MTQHLKHSQKFEEASAGISYCRVSVRVFMGTTGWCQQGSLNSLLMGLLSVILGQIMMVCNGTVIIIIQTIPDYACGRIAQRRRV